MAVCLVALQGQSETRPTPEGLRCGRVEPAGHRPQEGPSPPGGPPRSDPPKDQLEFSTPQNTIPNLSIFQNLSHPKTSIRPQT